MCRYLRGISLYVQEMHYPNPEKQQQGVSLTVWRAPLRNGLFMYTSSAIYEGTTAAAVRAFSLDDAYRSTWDKKHVHAKRLALEGGTTSRHSCLQHYRFAPLTQYCNCQSRGKGGQ